MNEKKHDSNDDKLNDVLAEYLIAIDNGDTDTAEEIVNRNSQFASQIKQFAENKRLIDQFAMTRGRASANSQLGETGAASGFNFIAPTVDQLQEKFPTLEIIELIGCGGMGAVYKARQKNLDRIVALKLLPPHVKSIASFAERFMREAKAMARLSHPNIVAIFECGETDGLFYLTMEFIDGVNLRQAMQLGDVEPDYALKIVPQICDALYFAHQQGIVHRDIKPENILVGKNGVVKIADFGLAKVLEEVSAEHQLTGTQQVLGTLRYMAPEQLDGAKNIDHRADIYSLGVVFYELLTGQLPVGRFERPSETAEIDARLDEVVLRSLERSPDRRYQQADEIKTDISSIAVEPQTKNESENIVQRGASKTADNVFFPGTQIFWLNIVLIFVGFLLIGLVCLSWTMVTITDNNNRQISNIGASGFKHIVPCFGFLLATGLIASTFLSIHRRFVFWRALLTIGTGTALFFSALYVILFHPLTSHNNEYARAAKEVDRNFFSEQSALLELQRLEQFRNLDIMVVPATGAYLAMILGVVIMVIGVFELNLSATWTNRSLDASSKKKIVSWLGTGLQLTGILSFIFAFVAVGSWFVMQFFGSLSRSNLFNYGGELTAFLHFSHALVIAPLLILAGHAARNCQQRGFVILGIACAMVPISYATAIGLPVAILLIIVIAENRFGKDILDLELKDGQSSKRGLRIAGGIQFTNGLITLIGFSIAVFVFLIQEHYFEVPFLILGLALALLQMVSGYFMMRLQSYRAAWASAFVGLLPFSYLWPVSFPVSVWTIFKLRQKFSDGKTEFKSAAFLFNEGNYLAALGK